MKNLPEVEKIYFDMDGVIVDFWGGLAQMYGEVDTDDFDKVCDAVKSIEHFYSKLKPVNGAIEMFRRFYEKYGDKCEILTAIPAESKNIPYAAEDKRKWAADYLGSDVRINIVYRKEKKDFCHGKGYILIDDYHKNIEDWESLGGTAIFFKSIEQIYELFFGADCAQ